MQNNPGLLSLTEGPPLDQIIGRAVDTSLPSIASAGGRHTISHTHPDVFQSGSPIVPADVYLLPRRCSAARPPLVRLQSFVRRRKKVYILMFLLMFCTGNTGFSSELTEYITIFNI